MPRHVVRQTEMHGGLAPREQKVELGHMGQLQMGSHHAELQGGPILQSQQAVWKLALQLEMLQTLDLCVWRNGLHKGSSLGEQKPEHMLLEKPAMLQALRKVMLLLLLLAGACHGQPLLPVR